MLRVVAVLLAAFLLAPTARAQLADEQATAGAVRYGKPVVGEFRVGAEITAKRGAVRDIRAMVAVPFECEEQTVRIASEDFTSDVGSVTYRDLQGGARQMLITIPYLASGATARAIVTFDVATRPILPPSDEEIDALVIPRRPPRDLRKFTSVSPFIEAKDRKIKRIARETLGELPEDASGWTKVEALYDYVWDNIEDEDGPDTSAVQTLKEGIADCHGRSALFIALCRASGVPARVVWVNHHCYAEFYMEDEEGNGDWYPAESRGTRAFGEMPLARVILQKGDNFRVPERPRDRLRYATDFLVGLPVKGSGQPSVRYIREQL